MKGNKPLQLKVPTLSPVDFELSSKESERGKGRIITSEISSSSCSTRSFTLSYRKKEKEIKMF
jgi:hypothetical protein